MNKKLRDSNLVSALIGGGIALIIVFIGPLRTMATQNDIKDFVTKTEARSMIPIDGYIEDRALIMDYLDRLSELNKQMQILNQTMSSLQTEISYLRAALPVTK